MIQILIFFPWCHLWWSSQYTCQKSHLLWCIVEQIRKVEACFCKFICYMNKVESFLWIQTVCLGEIIYNRLLFRAITLPIQFHKWFLHIHHIVAISYSEKDPVKLTAVPSIKTAVSFVGLMFYAPSTEALLEVHTNIRSMSLVDRE